MVRHLLSLFVNQQIYSQTKYYYLICLLFFHQYELFINKQKWIPKPKCSESQRNIKFNLKLFHIVTLAGKTFIKQSAQFFTIIKIHKSQKMFSAKIQEGTIFRKLIESIKDLVKLVNIDVAPQGLSIQAMDSSHVALVALNLKEKGFQQYRCDKPITLGLSIENVSKILKCAGNQDSITLECSEDPQVLKFKFESKKGDKISEFSLKLVTIDAEQLGIPDTQFSSICTLPATEFSRICRQFGGISQTIKIQTNKQHIKLSVHGELGDGNTILRAKDASKQEDSVTLQVDEPVNLSFSARYLNQFSKASAVSNKVTLSMSADTPLLVEYKIESSQNRTSLGELRYYLAPKITDEAQ